MRYADVSQREGKFLDMTSLTVEEFGQLLPAFEEAFQERMKEWCLDGKKRTGRRYLTYANCPLPTPEDRLLFIASLLEKQFVAGLTWGAVRNAAKQSQSVDSYVVTGVANSFENAWGHTGSLDGAISPALGQP